MTKQLVIAAGMLAATVLVVFAGRAKAEDIRDVNAVLCDRVEELESVYAIHQAMPELEFASILEQVKAKIGSDNCLPVLAKVAIIETVKTLENGTLDILKVDVRTACRDQVCFNFHGQAAYLLLRRKPDATA